MNCESPASYNNDTNTATTNSGEEANWACYIRVNNLYHIGHLEELPSILWCSHEIFSIWSYLIRLVLKPIILKFDPSSNNMKWTKLQIIQIREIKTMMSNGNEKRKRTSNLYLHKSPTITASKDRVHDVKTTMSTRKHKLVFPLKQIQTSSKNSESFNGRNKERTKRRTS